MRSLIVMLGLLLAYTFLYAGFSYFGLPWFASPAGGISPLPGTPGPSSTKTGSGSSGKTSGKGGG